MSTPQKPAHVIVPISISEAAARTNLDKVVARIKSAVEDKPASLVELSFPAGPNPVPASSWFNVADFEWNGRIICGRQIDSMLRAL